MNGTICGTAGLEDVVQHWAESNCHVALGREQLSCSLPGSEISRTMLRDVWGSGSGHPRFLNFDAVHSEWLDL
jgi:hypothetical protein